MTTPRTLGVEEEFHVVDATTGRLTARAPELLRALPTDGFSVEMQRSTVETNTAVCGTLTELRAQLVERRTTADAVARAAGLALIATGSAPMSRDTDFELTTLGRFDRMRQDYRFLVDDQLICSLQVHVGLDDRDTAVRVAQRIAPDLPTLLAMTASSPYWHGADTGYSSFRTMVWQRWPTAGPFGPAEDAAAYDRLVDDLIGSGVISDPAMAYFDVRPSAHVPTLELRVCDSCPIVDDVVLVAALYRAMVARAVEADGRGDPLVTRPTPVHRAAMWRAARNGLHGPLLTPDLAPRPKPALEVLRELVARLDGPLADTGDTDTVRELTESLVVRGDASRRQRARYAVRGEIADVVRLVVDETRGRTDPSPPILRITADYPTAPDDEALVVSGIPLLPYRPVFEALDRLAPEELRARIDRMDGSALADGLTFRVDGQEQPFPVDIVPRILPAHEWSVLVGGLQQRARAIELFLRDVYGAARIVRDGVVPSEVVERSPGWDPSARRLPPSAVRAPIIGFDVVQDTLGGWRVLEDNTRTPSGVGYAIGMRRLMHEMLPELAGNVRIHDPRLVLELLGRTLRAASPRPDPVVALLSDGSDNSAWYEHRAIAAGAGLVLCEPKDVRVDDGRVLVRGEPVDVLYLRLEVELAQLHTPEGDPIGAGILTAAQSGAVALANAPGAGVADDKSLYCWVPDMISYYLGERPLLSPVPTYRCGVLTERRHVLGRLGQLVTKPVDGFGGTGVLIGPDATEAELAERRAAIEDAPDSYIGQEVVAMSTHPTLAGDALEPRHVDLRAFAFVVGTGPDDVTVGNLALTRVAPHGSMVVNSSRGGGAKDTWIVADDPAHGDPARDPKG